MPESSVKRTLFQRLFYRLVKWVSQLIVITWCDFRTEGRENIPELSGGLIVSNHQSVLDPVLVGINFNRRLNYLARKTLFKNPVFAALIRVLDAIEINRDGSGLAGLKETLRRLKRDELVLIFPEGTRTKTGNLLPLKSGFISVARRSKQPLIPVAIDGAFQVLAKRSILPTRLPIAVVIAPPIPHETIAELNDDELIHVVSEKLEEAFARARKLREN